MSVAVCGRNRSDFIAGAARWLGRLSRSARLVLMVPICLAILAGPALAQTPVSLQLVLAVDASGSVSHGRFELQKQGYAAAFRSPRVLQAIRASAMRSIAVAMVQWTGPTLHVIAVDWTLVDSEATSMAFAAAIEAAPRQLFGGGTSISGAIDFAKEMLADKRFRGER